MPLAKKPVYIKEPTPLQCGQAVLAMLTGLTVEEIVRESGTDRETRLADMFAVLERHGIAVSRKRQEAADKESLPRVSLLSLETPRCWHWSLCFDGVILDPEHGILNDFPESGRKYFWEILLKVD